MGTVKRTYSLPSETARGFESRVARRQRSATVARIVEDWMEAEERDRLRKEVVEGLAEMEEVYLEIEREYHILEEEVERELSK